MLNGIFIIYKQLPKQWVVISHLSYKEINENIHFTSELKKWTVVLFWTQSEYNFNKNKKDYKYLVNNIVY